MLLAIDTATAYMSLALHDDQRVIAESTWVSPNNHTVELAPAVHAMLVRAGIAIDALTALAVAIGPGSYSALRIGVSFAKAVAAARELPLIGMTTLDILSASQHRYPGELIPTAQAGRGRVIAARYTWNAVINRWTRAELMQNWEWAALIAAIEQRATPTWVTGEIDADAEHAIAAANAPITLVDTGSRLRRAGYLASEALVQLRASADARSQFLPAALVPIYIKSI